MDNNLLNIKPSDVVYKNTMTLITEYLPDDVKQYMEVVEQLPIISTDDFFIHYSVSPRLTSKQDDKVLAKALEFQRKYIESDDYQRIKTITTLDDELSLIHAVSLTKQILKAIEEELKKQKPKPQGGGGGGGQQQQFSNALEQLQHLLQKTQQGGKQGQQARQQAQQLIQQALQKVLSNTSKMKKMVAKANKQTEKADDLKKLVRGVGKEPGTFELILDLSEKMLNVTMYDEIITYGKRLYERMTRFTHLRKEVSRLGDEIRGYTVTRKIERALPKELALPEEIFLLKLASQGLLTREKVILKEGAYYVLIDKSGSMEGEKTIWARSVALALFMLAQRKKRKYFLRFFDTRVYPSEPITNPIKALQHILGIKSNGGTDITNAIRTAVKDLENLKEYTNTIIIITDGEDTVNVKPEELLRENISLIAVMIKGHNETLRTLAEKTKGVYMMAQLNEEGALEILSIAEKK